MENEGNPNPHQFFNSNKGQSQQPNFQSQIANAFGDYQPNYYQAQREKRNKRGGISNAGGGNSGNSGRGKQYNQRGVNDRRGGDGQNGGNRDGFETRYVKKVEAKEILKLSDEEKKEKIVEKITLLFQIETLKANRYVVTKFDDSFRLPIGVIFRENSIREITNDLEFFKSVLQEMSVANLKYIEGEEKLQLDIPTERKTIILKEVAEDKTETELKSIIEVPVDSMIQDQAQKSVWYLHFAAEMAAKKALRIIKSKAASDDEEHKEVTLRASLKGVSLSSILQDWIQGLQDQQRTT